MSSSSDLVAGYSFVIFFSITAYRYFLTRLDMIKQSVSIGVAPECCKATCGLFSGLCLDVT